MKKMTLIVVIISLTAGSIAQDTTKRRISLKQAVETAVNNNLLVKQSDLQVQTEEVNWKQARANRFPNLSGFLQHGMNQGRSIDPFTNAYINQNVNYAQYSLQSGTVLFNGFGIHHNIRQNALGHQAAKMELQQSKDELTLNVILAYLQVLTNIDQLAQSRNQANVSREQATRLEILFKEGAVIPSQYYDVKGQLAGDELSIINNRNALNSSLLALSQLMNVPVDTSLEVERLSIDQFSMTYGSSPEEIYNISLQQLAVVKAASLRRQSSAKGVQAARGNLFPRLSFNTGLGTNYSSAAFQDIFLNSTEVPTNNYVIVNGVKTPVISPQNNFQPEKIVYRNQLQNNLSTSFSLGLSIPIFNALQARTQVRLAKISEKNSQYIEETIRIQLKQNIEEAYFNMTAAEERYRALGEQVAAYAESFRAAEVRLNAGVGTSVDYVLAKNNLDRANINLISARYDYLLRTKILDYYQNKPLW